MLEFNLTIEIALIKKKSSKHQETTTDTSLLFYVVSFHIHDVNINKQLNIGSRTCGRDVT